MAKDSSISLLANGVWFIETGFAANYLPAITAYLRGQNIDFHNFKRENPFSALALQGDENQLNEFEKPEQIQIAALAILEVKGAITKEDQFCGPVGTQTLSNILRGCYSNPQISSVVLKIDSGGGEVYAMNLLADTIGERTKPVIAFIDDFAASAAYGIASACDHIVANNNMAWVGSIGCYTTFVDYSKYWEKEGIRVEDIYADQSTEKNSEYREALKGNFEPMRKITSHFAEDFISRVENSRGEKLTAKRDVWATGKMFFAPQALKIGLIDEINSFENLIKNLL